MITTDLMSHTEIRSVIASESCNLLIEETVNLIVVITLFLSSLNFISFLLFSTLYLRTHWHISPTTNKMKLTNILTISAAFVCSTSGLAIPANVTSTALSALSTAIMSSTSTSTALTQPILDPTPTIDEDAVIYPAKAAPTAGISPKSTYPAGYGQPLAERMESFHKRVHAMLGWGLIFPVILAAFACWCILAPMQRALLKPAYMRAQLERGTKQRIVVVAAIKEERARGKFEREEERSQKKLRQAAEMHMAPMSDLHANGAEK